MSEVIISQQLYPDLYHSKECVAANRIKNQKRMSQEQAEKMGMDECMICQGEAPIPAKDQSQSLRSMVFAGEVGYESD